jgi:CRISPR system Cascade subunit CasE
MMGILTKLEIDYETASIKIFSDLYSWHKTAWELFPGKPEAKRDFLTRLDVTANGFRLYVLSGSKPVKPEWCEYEAFSTKEIAPGFLGHTLYRFDLRANPTRKIKKLDSEGNVTKNGKRVALLGEKEQMDWLRRKAGENGFKVLENPKPVIDPAERNDFCKHNTPGMHFGVRFTGALKVTDRKAFGEAFYNGIGSAKGFGFGLLLLKPVE